MLESRQQLLRLTNTAVCQLTGCKKGQRERNVKKGLKNTHTTPIIKTPDKERKVLKILVRCPYFSAGKYNAHKNCFEERKREVSSFLSSLNLLPRS